MRTTFFFVLLVVIAVSLGLYINKKSAKPNPLKLYWFIPDGVRAEPDLFTIYQWAQAGKLPNIKKLMSMGTYGYSKPVFPSHTPVNFAALLTGTYPAVNGVDDGPMHALGKPLDKVAVPGFRSVARKVPAIWKTLEEKNMKVTILSVPGSTPPEIEKGVVLRGRWGGWGADFYALNFETKGDLSQRIKQGRAARLFFFGPQLTQYLDPVTPTGWTKTPTSYSLPLELTLTGWGTPVYVYIYDSTNDGQNNYDTVALSKDKKTIFTTLKQGDWSNWQPIILKWQADDKTIINVDSDVKANLIKLDNDGFFRIRLFYNNLNRYITYPAESADMMKKAVGPMVDFVDNFPFQLGFYPEDKKTFLDEAKMSFDWHAKAVSALVNQFSPDVIIHDIYTPNQMLTANWWMGNVDPKSARYYDISATDRQQAWNDVMNMYKRLDNIVGEIIKVSGPNTYIVFSSDHGNIPLDKYVNINNLFAQKGWLKFTLNPQTGEPVIDWKNTKVIYMKMAYVYINPKGLDGNYHRASGSAYEVLRNEVRQTLETLTDDNGVKPVVAITNWEDAKQFLKMDPDRVGDLVLANAPGYWFNEEMSNDGKLYEVPRESGYKQAVDPNIPGMWTPFIIAGPGIKKNNFLGNKPFELIDQYPTIMKALGVKTPDFVQGKALNIFEK